MTPNGRTRGKTLAITRLLDSPSLNVLRADLCQRRRKAAAVFFNCVSYDSCMSRAEIAEQVQESCWMSVTCMGFITSVMNVG